MTDELDELELTFYDSTNVGVVYKLKNHPEAKAKLQALIEREVVKARIDEMKEWQRHIGSPQKNHPIYGDERYYSVSGFIKARLAQLKESSDE